MTISINMYILAQKTEKIHQMAEGREGNPLWIHLVLKPKIAYKSFLFLCLSVFWNHAYTKSLGSNDSLWVRTDKTVLCIQVSAAIEFIHVNPLSGSEVGSFQDIYGCTCSRNLRQFVSVHWKWRSAPSSPYLHVPVSPPASSTVFCFPLFHRSSQNPPFLLLFLPLCTPLPPHPRLHSCLLASFLLSVSCVRSSLSPAPAPSLTRKWFLPPRGAEPPLLRLLCLWASCPTHSLSLWARL